MDFKTQKRSSSETYWPVSVSDTQLQFVLCKGVSYPGLSPRPIVSGSPFTMPLCDLTSQRSALEQGRLLNFVRSYDLGNVNTIEKVCLRMPGEKIIL